MAVMRPGVFLCMWTVLLCISAYFGAKADTVVTTVALSFEQPCEMTYTLSRDVETTYRVMMQKLWWPVSGHNFTCTVYFSTEKADIFHYYGRHNRFCVDFARVLLIGEDTRLTISGSRYGKTWELTEEKYPRSRSDMETLQCYTDDETASLTFEATYAGDSKQMRDYFVSYIYVYSQPKDNNVFLYHIDGACLHRYDLKAGTTLKMRSYIWEDTADESTYQVCKLVLKSESDFDALSTNRVCATWYFKRQSCMLYAYFREVILSESFSSGGSRSYGCRNSKSKNMDGCVPYSYYKLVIFEVKRINDHIDARSQPDGSLFFEADAVLNKIEERSNYGVNDDSDIDDINTIDDVDNNLAMKILLPIALLFSVCCGICGISRKRAKERAEQGELHPVEMSNVESPAAADADARAREPLNNPTYNSTHDNWSTRSPDFAGYRGGNPDPMAAPPPSYREVERMTPSNARRPYDYRSSPTHPSVSPHPAVSQRESDSVPPPPISAGASGAPPAYHELFPSQV